MRKINTRIFLLYTFCFLLLNSCKKAKLDHIVDHTNPFEHGKLSQVRLVNAAEYLDLEFNGNRLTSFNPISTEASPTGDFGGPWYGYLPGTQYFPLGGCLGREWRIPAELLRENGRMDIFFQRLVGFPNASINPIGHRAGLTATITGDRPVDYYLGYHPDYGNYRMVPREETSASKSENIRIRIINMTTNYYVDPTFFGPVTLTYANGTSVSPKTSALAVGAISDYVELPYGSYQFRVMTNTGWQIPGTDGKIDHMFVDPSKLSIVHGKTFDQPAINSYLVHAPIHTYQPGGIYTIYVYPSQFAYNTVGSYEATKLLSNAFRIIQDNFPAVNLAHCRAQGFNAIPGGEYRLRFNQQHTTDPLVYGTASAYVVQEPGEVVLSLIDRSGNVVASKSYLMEANQNYTICAFPNTAGDPQLMVMANDLSNAAGVFPFRKRFLNLCPDIPFLTFTTNDGASLGAPQSANLQPGIAVTRDPYVNGSVEQPAYEILAYRSAPGKVPGTWADDIPLLHSTDFIANRQLYRRFEGNLPVHESGYYTVALIGRTGTNVPQAQKAKIVVIKHNQ